MPTSYTLYEVNEYIKRVVALNFQEPIWVKCEISQASLSRGSVYLTVVQQDEQSQDIIAQTQAVIWPRSYLFLKNKLGELLSHVLESGTDVMMKVNVDYHERYGLKLVVEDVDASYTLGRAEMERQKIIERLKKEGRMEVNARIAMPKVIQYVAVISSERAAGYKDFIHQLDNNAYGYDYYTELFDAAMQGRNVESEVLSALKRIEESPYQFDAIAIIRGGGSKLDLGGFDNYNIAHAISECGYPVIVGIGHEIDTTVADLVAHTSLKTPTAVAEYLIQRSMHTESQIMDIAQQIQQGAKAHIMKAEAELEMNGYKVQQISQDIMGDMEQELNYIQQQLSTSTSNYLKNTEHSLDNFANLIAALSPERTLARGYAIIRQDDKALSGISEIKKNKTIEIVMQDGKVER